MRTLNWLFAIGLVASMSACGDDDDGTTPGMDSGMGGVDSGGGGTDSGGGGTDSGGGGTDSGMTMDDAGGGGDDAGTMTDSGGMASAEAIAFCTLYETTCTYGGMSRYGDEDTCLTEYDAADMGCQDCIDDHLMNAVTMDADTHCPHATTTASPAAMGPCREPCM